MKLFLKTGFSIGALAFLFSRMDLTAALSRVGNLDTVTLAAAVAAILAGFFLGAWKWQLLVRPLESDAGYGKLLRIFWVGAFFNNVLPGRTGGDFYRSYAVSRTSLHTAAAAISVPVDRGLNLVALVIIALIAHSFAPAGFDLASWKLLGVGSAVVGSSLLLLPVLLYVAHKHSVSKRLAERTLTVMTPFRTLLSAPRTLALIVVLSISNQVLMVLANLCVARSLGIDLHPIYFFAFVPLTAIVSVLPVSINGFGIREGAFAAAFAQLDVATGAAVSVSLVTVFLNLGVSLLGALLYVAEPRTRLAGTTEARPVTGTST